MTTAEIRNEALSQMSAKHAAFDRRVARMRELDDRDAKARYAQLLAAQKAGKQPR